jgi:hypothetical protein
LDDTEIGIFGTHADFTVGDIVATWCRGTAMLDNVHSITIKKKFIDDDHVCGGRNWQKFRRSLRETQRNNFAAAKYVTAAQLQWRQ